MLSLSETKLFFGKYAQQTFDETPLEYLDWLSGQPWVYGALRHRLTKYLQHPPIQRELERLFPDSETEPTNFEPSQFLRKHKWHGQTIPRQYRDPPTKTRGQQWKEAWERAADYLDRFQTAEDPNDLLDLDFADLKATCESISREAAQKLRDAYRLYRQRLRATKAQPVGNIYRAIELGVPVIIPHKA